MRFDYLLKKASIATIILTFSLTAVGKIPIAENEGGLIQSLTVVFFLLAAFYQLRIARTNRYKVFHIILLSLFIFGAIEELSYLQKHLPYNYDTSSNTGDEINIHNTDICYFIQCPEFNNGFTIEIQILIYIGVLFFGLSLILSKIPFIGRIYKKLKYPGFNPVVGIFLVLSVAFLFLTYPSPYEEMIDLVTTFLFYLYSNQQPFYSNSATPES